MTSSLILHCGPYKTGTSAIQAHLTSIAPGGLVYPVTGRWLDGAHHKISFALDGLTWRGDVEIPQRDRLLEDLNAEIAASTGDVLISSEHLSVTRAEELGSLLLDAHPGRFDRVRRILVLRHPLERAASAYNQDVKDPVSSESRWPDAYLRESGRRFHLSPMVRAWAGSGPGTAEFLSYHPSRSLVARFFDHLGLPVPEAAAARHNGSLNGYGLVALLAANRIALDAGTRAVLFDALRDDRTQRIWNGDSFPFSARAARAYLDTLGPDLDALQALTGLDLRALHPRPPVRFRLDAPRIDRLRAQFAPLDLTPRQGERLDRILTRFGPAPGADTVPPSQNRTQAE